VMASSKVDRSFYRQVAAPQESQQSPMLSK
jgi:hypothetical protein